MNNATAQQHGTPLQLAMRRLRRNRMAVASLVTLTLLVLLSLVGPLLTPYGYDDQDRTIGATPPSVSHWLGTDDLGRDLLSRLLHGGRVSLAIGCCATVVSLLIGVLYGAISGYCGGRVDGAMMRVVDVLYALPFTIFVIVLTVVFGRSFLLLFVAIGAVEWLTMARIVRGQVLSKRRELFVTACEALGYSHTRILLRHIIPNVLGPVVVFTTLTIPRVILLESFLSFLGLGVQAPHSSWGSLIQDGARAMEYCPWLLLAPALTLSMTLFSLNFLGDGLRDAIDPRSARRG